MLRINTLRTLPLVAAAALAAFAVMPSAAGATSGQGGGSGGKVHYGDLAVGMSAAEPTSFFAFDPAFRGGVVVAAGDVDGTASPYVITSVSHSAGDALD